MIGYLDASTYASPSDLDCSAGLLQCIADAAAGNLTVYVPAGQWRHGSTLPWQRLAGDGIGRTVLLYTGAESALRPGNGERTYRTHVTDVTLQDDGNADRGVDLESHSSGWFQNVQTIGFKLGWSMRSLTADGWCIYNTLVACEAFTPSVAGFDIAGMSSNENRLRDVRSNGSGGWGVRITGGNHNMITSGAFEAGQGGVYIDESQSHSGRNVVTFCRFENNADRAIAIGLGVEDTVLLFNDLTATGGRFVDYGTGTMRLDAQTWPNQ